MLSPELWPSTLHPRIRPGAPEDPLAGLVRFDEPPVDVIVGRGRVMRRAVQTASEHELLEDPVVSTLWLAMLKLEAGGVQELADLELLIEARRRRGQDLRSEVDGEAGRLSDWGRRAWARVQRRLDERA